MFFFYCHVHHRDLHSFPTRRSSDLFFGDIPVLGHLFRTDRSSGERVERMFLISPRLSARRSAAFGAKPAAPEPAPAPARSEEHTSELQSRRDLVCRLLLEKKNLINF